ncbi:MAG: acyl carrier protein [Treponema sp.]|nr:acyl carrier protein [Treponema sp.]
MCKDDVYAAVKKLLMDKFGLQEDMISPDKLLEDELDFDSLDAVDLLIYLENHIEGKPESSIFRNVKTVQDVVDILYPLWKNEA